MTTVAEFLAEHLAQAGHTDAFVVTGGGAMFLNDALCHQSGIAPVCFHHEQAAAMATGAYARFAEQPPLAYSVEKVGPTKYWRIAGVPLPFRDLRSSILRRSERSIFHQPKTAAEKPTFSTQ